MNQACKECGGCCCKAVVIEFAESLPEDYKRWLLSHGEKWDDNRFVFEAPCRRLVKGKCEIHSDRPMMCQKFEVGSQDCLRAIYRYHRKPINVLQHIPNKGDE